ncbi:hypothetical protein [Halalkalibacter oceani]|uniref:Uncharacterized protein n=1 Tax=Halalkalibacter oceani TaxID=1653776 RepID=A0A9X2DVM9_9BACI|nr:hypothetical protein [Halalkalibacter oceani]MCM3716245.1 hypothetical protein [Halalkalibacter oceani]
MIRLFFVLTGILLAVGGGVSILAYLNLLTTGYHFTMYLAFLVNRIELYLFLAGVALTIGALMFPSSRKRRRPPK